MIEQKNNPAIETKEDDIDIEETKRVLLNMLDNKKDIKNIEDQENAKAIDENTKKWNTNDKVLELFAIKIKKDTELKGKYAIILIGILIFQLIVLNILFIQKGKGELEFSDTTFNIFITGGIAEIFVLVKTIVEHLFKDDLAELLKIILKANNYKFKDSNDSKNKKKEN